MFRQRLFVSSPANMGLGFCPFLSVVKRTPDALSRGPSPGTSLGQGAICYVRVTNGSPGFPGGGGPPACPCLPLPACPCLWCGQVACCCLSWWSACSVCLVVVACWCLSLPACRWLPAGACSDLTVVDVHRVTERCLGTWRGRKRCIPIGGITPIWVCMGN